jgi:hypothetical protein
MYVIEVTQPTYPDTDVNGQPVAATLWRVYVNGTLTAEDAIDVMIIEIEITDPGDYTVEVSIVNAVGEGEKSDPVTVTLVIPAGVPQKPGVPGVQILGK